MTKQATVVRYEDAAKRVTVTGWACKTCGNWFGDMELAEHLARWCCSTDQPCDCGGRKQKPYVCCEKCRTEREAARWAARERKPWDGTTPLFSYLLDRYIFGEDDLADAIEDAEGGDLRLVFCTPVHAHELDLSDWCDELPDDNEAPAWLEGLIDQFNAGVKAHSNEPLSWEVGNVVALVDIRQESSDA